MSTHPFLASLLKVLLVGGVMAGGAGGFYFIAANRPSNENNSVVAPTLTASPNITPGTGTAAVPTTSTGTPAAGTPTPSIALTDTGYKASDGSPLYKECIGLDPLALARGTPRSAAPTLPLPPPTLPTQAPGGFLPLPSPPADPNPNPRPPAQDLPAFDVVGVQASDPAGWTRVSTPCLGGLSMAIPTAWTALDDFAVGGYQQGAGAIFRSTNGLVKVDMTYRYTLDDLFTRRRNSSAGNGSYYLARNAPTTVGGASGTMDISSEIVLSTRRYVVVSYLISPRPNWFLGYVGFFYQPYNDAAFADFYGMVNSTRFTP
jgi:hypothetical protein